MTPRIRTRAAVVAAVSAAFLVAASQVLHAQMGNDNPTGPAGIFNGNIETAGNYDPYTANAVRQITDITVYGAVQPTRVRAHC